MRVLTDEPKFRSLTSNGVETYREYLRKAEMLIPSSTASTPIAIE
jgi:hypothetical protein